MKWGGRRGKGGRRRGQEKDSFGVNFLAFYM